MKRFVKFIFKSVGIIFLLFIVLVIVLDIITPQDDKDKINLESTYVAIKSLTQTAEPTLTIANTPKPTITITPIATIAPIRLSLTEQQYREYITAICISKLHVVEPETKKYDTYVTQFIIFEKQDDPRYTQGKIIFKNNNTNKEYTLFCATVEINGRKAVRVEVHTLQLNNVFLDVKVNYLN